MKKIFILLSLVSLLFTSCHLNVWGGDGELLVDEVTLEISSRKEIGKYRVHCVVLNGYQEMLSDYITINTDSLYRVGDTIYIGK